jgi:antitoxin VapB
MNGRSQAVRLPKEFRFDGRVGDSVVLEPVRTSGWPPGFWEQLGRLPEDFAVPPPLPPGGAVVDFDAP